MPPELESEGFPWSRAVHALAYTLLIIAFVIGQIAARTDYDALLKEQMPDLDLVQIHGADNPPIVYRITDENNEDLEDVVAMAHGEGYGGSMIIGIKAKKNIHGVASIQEIILLDHRETPAYIEQIQTKYFFRKFINKKLTDDFIAGSDIDAVSGATISSKAIISAVRTSAHLGAEKHLSLEATWVNPKFQFGKKEFGLILLFIAAFATMFYFKGKYKKYARIATMVAALIFVGFYANISLSIGSLAGIVMGYIPTFRQHPLWWIMMCGTLGSVFIIGRNVYCQHICPFNVVQTALQKISGISLRIDSRIQKQARTLIFVMSWTALMLIFLSAHPTLGSYEPFSMMFSLQGMGIQWYILPAALIGSFFVPSFWCRLFCPVGLFLNEGVRFRKMVKSSLVNLPPPLESEQHVISESEEEQFNEK